MLPMGRPHRLAVVVIEGEPRHGVAAEIVNRNVGRRSTAGCARGDSQRKLSAIG